MTTYTINNELNYAAEVVRLKANNFVTLEGLDRLVGVAIKGQVALVQKGQFQAGDTAVLFPTECQLSDAFCKEHGLYREDGGYIEKNRRVRAIKLRGHYSTALLLPNTEDIPEGTIFDTIDGVEVCRKYVPRTSRKGNPSSGVVAAKKNKTPYVDARFFPEHMDTRQFHRFPELLDPKKVTYITQKLHGCFTSRTKVSMWDGTRKPITRVRAGDIVVGLKDGELVPATVKRDAFTTGETDSWLRTTFKQPRKGDNPVTYSTPEHQFLTPNGYVEAHTLKMGDTVYYASRSFPSITPEKMSVLIGLMLGDGSIAGQNRNSLEWSHKSEHEEYMDYLLSLLGNVHGTGDFARRVSGYGTHILGGRTQALPEIGDFVRSWPSVFENLVLDPMILAIWYMDDGSLAHHEGQQDRANFAICSFTDEQVGYLDTALKNYGFSNYTFYQTKNKPDGPSYWRLRLNKDDADKLFRDIRHLVPPVMQFKLSEKHRSYFNPPQLDDAERFYKYETHVLSSELVPASKSNPKTKWDIETTTGNFLAQGIVVHNSSVRLGNTYVNRKPTLKERIAKWFGVDVAPTMAVVGGSRKVVKTDPTRSEGGDFYDVDIWAHATERYGELIPPNVIVYGELVGFVPGTSTPIQPRYTYNAAEGDYELYVYRVAVIASDGSEYDLPDPTMREFCAARGLKVVPLLSLMRADSNIIEYFVNDYVDVRMADEYRKFPDMFMDEPVPLSDPDTVDEGVVLRQDGLRPTLLKWKGPVFLQTETEQLDEGVGDYDGS